MVTLAVSSWSLRQHINKDFPLSNLIHEVKNRFGITQVELCQQHFLRQDASYLNSIVKNLQEAGGTCVNMPIDVGNISSPNEAERFHDIHVIEGWFRVAAYINCPMVRVNTGHADDPGALDRVVDSYLRLAELAHRIGVSLVLENHGGLSSDPATVLQLVKRVGLINMGLCPDFGNFKEEERYDALTDMLPFSNIVHAKYHQPGTDRAQWDWPRCVQIIRDSSFDGPVSIEIGQHLDAWQAVHQALALWKEAWQQ